MLVSTLYTYDNDHDRLLGTIRWDGEQLTFSPPSADMRRLAGKPIRAMVDGAVEEISPDDRPELFVKSLWLHYKSIGLRASKAVERG